MGLLGARHGALGGTVGSGDKPRGAALVGAGGDQGLSQICSQTGPWGASGSVSTSSGGGGFGVELGSRGVRGAGLKGPRAGEERAEGSLEEEEPGGLQTLRARR